MWGVGDKEFEALHLEAVRHSVHRIWRPATQAFRIGYTCRVVPAVVQTAQSAAAVVPLLEAARHSSRSTSPPGLQGCRTFDMIRHSYVSPFLRIRLDGLSL